MPIAINLGDNLLGGLWDSITCGPGCERDRIKMKLEADRAAFNQQSQLAYLASLEQAQLSAQAKKRTALIIGGIVLVLAIIGALIFLTMNTEAE